jgi:hypothetical protein
LSQQQRGWQAAKHERSPHLDDRKNRNAIANGIQTKKKPRDGHITGLLHRSMAKAEETSSDRLTDTDSRMQMQ